MTPRERWPSLADGIYAIVDTAVTADPVGFGAALVAGGIRVVQLRAKDGIDPAQLRALVACAHADGALLIVNDDVEAARSADGIHLGQEDAALVDLAVLRGVLADKVIGLSCGTPAEAEIANAVGADYLGVGPMFATASKSDAGAPIGVAGVAAVVRASRVPVVAIGGIDRSRLGDVRASGATMAAMISALAGATDVAATARALVAAWESRA
ncbi:MAG TPA: thiamine phosphate synthase [Candidatus Binatia bacterium]|nr:thiamine phosphate synthase [Candidatus Binatia bacterium]